MTITALTGENEISNLVVENGTPGYELSPPLHKLGWKASDTRELSFRDCAVPEENLLGDARPGPPAVPRDPRRRPDLGRGDGRRARAGRLRPRLRLREGAPPVRQADLGVPGDPVQARRHGRRDRGGRGTSSTRRRGSRTRAATSRCAAAMAKLYTGELSNRAVNAALQIHGGYGYMDEYRDLAPLPRPEDPRDRRGDERGAADRDREAARVLDGHGPEGGVGRNGTRAESGGGPRGRSRRARSTTAGS